jgi:hypothetical protein
VLDGKSQSVPGRILRESSRNSASGDVHCVESGSFQAFTDHIRGIRSFVAAIGALIAIPYFSVPRLSPVRGRALAINSNDPSRDD